MFIVRHKPLFTFHHVSIKTLRPLYNSQRPPAFTFHHVSIKTRLCVTVFMYVKIHIPPCIY